MEEPQSSVPGRAGATSDQRIPLIHAIRQRLPALWPPWRSTPIPHAHKLAIMQSGGAVHEPLCSSTTPSSSPMPPSVAYSSISIFKNGLVGRILTAPQEIESAQRLRYRIFVDDLKWVKGQNGLDRDEYDAAAVILGVVEGTSLRGTLRVRLPYQTFMLERDFKDLLHNHSLTKAPNVIEVSRLAFDPDVANFQLRRRIVFLLHYLLYRWMQRNELRYVYLVSTHKFITALRRTRGVTVRTFGRAAMTHDRESYQAAFIDMQEIMDWRHQAQFLLQYLFI